MIFFGGEIFWVTKNLHFVLHLTFFTRAAIFFKSGSSARNFVFFLQIGGNAFRFFVEKKLCVVLQLKLSPFYFSTCEEKKSILQVAKKEFFCFSLFSSFREFF